MRSLEPLWIRRKQGVCLHPRVPDHPLACLRILVSVELEKVPCELSTSWLAPHDVHSPHAQRLASGSANRLLDLREITKLRSSPSMVQQIHEVVMLKKEIRIAVQH